MIGTKRVGIAAGAAAWLAVTAATDTAHAWFERTITARTTSPAGSGCIQLVSGISHGNQNDPFTVTNEAIFRGLTAADATWCNADLPTDVFKMIEGKFTTLLLKQVNDGPTHDDAYLCSGFTSGMQYGDERLSFSYTFPSAPCGAGWYAIVTCLSDASVVRVPPWLEGYYSATSFSSAECNVSPWWHPFGVGDGHSPGGAVNL